MEFCLLYKAKVHNYLMVCLKISPAHDLEVAEQIYLRLLDCHGGDLVEQTVRDVITASPISWHTCRATLDYMLAELSTEDIAVLDIGEIDIKQILQNLKEIDAWSFLRQEADQRDSLDEKGRLAAYAEQCRLGGLATAERGRIWPVPRPMAKERYIIHAFSGRRRIGGLPVLCGAGARSSSCDVASHYFTGYRGGPLAGGYLTARGARVLASCSERKARGPVPWPARRVRRGRRPGVVRLNRPPTVPAKEGPD